MSTDVGVAPEILSRSALFNLSNFDYDPNKLVWSTILFQVQNILYLMEQNFLIKCF